MIFQQRLRKAGSSERNKTKQNRATLPLNDIITQVDFTDNYRMVYPNTGAHTFFSALDENFSQTDHVLGSKPNLNKY